MTVLQQLDREIAQQADARTPEVVQRLLERLERRANSNVAPPPREPVGPGCANHNGMLREYTKAAITLTRAKRDLRDGFCSKSNYRTYNAAERLYIMLREQYHNAVFRCGCSTKYDDEIAREIKRQAPVVRLGRTGNPITFTEQLRFQNLANSRLNPKGL